MSSQRIAGTVCEAAPFDFGWRTTMKPLRFARATIAAVLALVASVAAQEALDPSGGSRTLILGGERARFEQRFTTAHDGALYVYALSAHLDPRLRIIDDAGQTLAEDDDGGGGATAFVRVDLAPGDEVVVRVEVRGEPEGSVELRWIVAVESEVTRAAVARADQTLAELRERIAEKRLDEARALVNTSVAELLAVEGMQESGLVHSRLYRLADEGFELRALDGVRAAVDRLRTFHGRALPPDHPTRLATLNRAAWVHEEDGDHAAARDVLEQVLASLERTRARDDRDLRIVRNNLAVVRNLTGDTRGARELVEATLANESALGRADTPGYRVTLAIAGVLRQAEGDLDGARAALEQAVASYGEHSPPDDVQRVCASLALALVRRDAGDLDGARGLIERILADLDASPNDAGEYPHYVRCHLAEVLRLQGDLAHSIAILERARERFWRTLPKGDLQRLEVATSLAAARMPSGEDAPLVAAVAELCDELGAFAERLVEVGSPREVESALTGESVTRATNVLLSACAQLDGRAAGVERTVFERLEALRGLALGLARRMRAVNGVAELASGFAELRDAHAAVQRAAGSPEALEAAVRERDARHRRLIEAAREHGGAGGWELGDSRAALDARMGPDDALLAFRRFCCTRASGAAQDEFVVFAWRSDRSLRRIELGPAVSIEAAVHDWRDAVAEASDVERVRFAGNELRRRLLDPCEDLLEGAQRVAIVSDDALHLVPFDSLPSGEGLVGDRFEIGLRSALVEPDARAREDSATKLVALGGIDYDADAGDASASNAICLRSALPGAARGREVFPPLSGAKREVEALATLTRRVQGKRASVVLLTGAEATREAFELASRDAAVLHVATHGVFFEPQPGARSAAAAGGVLSLLPQQPLSPLLECGIALAGANREPDEFGRLPGLLTGEEIAGLDLARCELAVLSACETNVGRAYAGQGLASLQRAMRMAGVRTVVSSLWRVGDRATQEWMELFYEGLLEHSLTPARALWRAKRRMYDERRAHREWAGWVLTGASG